jgi:polyisoprenoid-binding protein YceI
MRTKIRYLQAVWIVIFALPTHAEQLSAELDKAKTKIAFTLTDVLHTVHGVFQLEEGRIMLDPQTSEIAGDIVVDAASGNSGSGARDRRMTREILEAQRFPEARFAPTNLTGSLAAMGSSKAEVRGSFFIHGQVHQITIPFQIEISPQEITATGKFTVPYVEWGMKNPSNFIFKVNDKVEIDLTAVGRLNAARTSR